MGRETVEFHYEKHHRGYLKKLRKAIEGTPTADLALEEIVRTSDRQVFNNSAQVWNHTFFWNGMQPRGGGEPGGEVGRRIKDSFGSFDKFREEFVQTGKSRFGSGYAWLVLEGDQLRCVSTLNAENPLIIPGKVALLCCDLWEHAYYLDHRNQRGTYLEGFLDHLVNWDFVAENLQRST
jgi:Fe-Mn family superoxide dismutase